jgi:hypothetical protein
MNKKGIKGKELYIKEGTLSVMIQFVLTVKNQNCCALIIQTGSRSQNAGK